MRRYSVATSAASLSPFIGLAVRHNYHQRGIPSPLIYIVSLMEGGKAKPHLRGLKLTVMALKQGRQQVHHRVSNNKVVRSVMQCTVELLGCIRRCNR